MIEENIVQFVREHPWRLVLYTGTSALGWLVAWGIRAAFREWTKNPCRWGHNRKYVELKYYTNYQCKEHVRIHLATEEWWATVARWLCYEENCAATGWECFGTKAWWKIEHNKVVLDKKKMESPPTDVESPLDAVKKQKKNEPKVLTFDDVFHAAEQALLKNAQKAFAGVEGKDYICEKQKMCDCGCECDPQFTAGLGELPRPKCDPLRHPQHHDIDVILAAKKKWAEEKNAKVCYMVAEKAKKEQSAKGPQA